MFNLIPAEHWDYSVADMIRNLGASLAPRPSGPKSNIEIPELGTCLPVRSARAAIVLGLKSLGLRPGAAVAVPLYCCPVVFSAIRAAGCHPRFIDVELNTFCLSADDLAAKNSEVDAVIAVHMFGNICNISAMRKATPNKPIIEDCAQALGSRFNGQLAGSFGEIAAFSFRSGKYLSVGEGGALYCGDPDLRSRVSKLIVELPIPGLRDEVVHVLATTIRSMLRRKPLWGLIGSRLWQAYSEKIKYSTQAPIVLGQIYKTDRDLIVKRLPQLAGFIEKQRSNADYYSWNLALDSDLLCHDDPATFSNRLQYPLLAPSFEQCDRLAKRLQQNQITTTRPYKDIVTIAAKYYGYSGDCPQAERIAKTILMLPCNYAINVAELEHITTCVNRAWKEVSHALCMNVPPTPSHSSVHRYSESAAEQQHSS